MTTPISSTDIIRLETSEPRRTTPGAGERFREALARGGSSLLSTVGSAAGVVPGGAVLSAAITSAEGGAATSADASALDASTSTSAELDAASMVEAQHDRSVELLMLQQQIAGEQQQFMTVSNVLKARHETNKSITQNFR